MALKAPNKINANILVLCSLLLSCSQKNSSDCSVTCPARSACQKDQCFPVCIPLCRPNQYCGADSQCHDGEAPDGAITVLPVDVAANQQGGDSGIGGQSQDLVYSLDGTSQTDSSSSSGLSAAHCECMKKNKFKACYKINASPCQTDGDCCSPILPIPCGTYGNKFICKAGMCEGSGCATDQECMEYATTIKDSEAAEWKCNPPLCPDTKPICLKTKTCNEAADCCNPQASASCGQYPEKWTCENHRCKSAGCESNNECALYGAQMGSPTPEKFQCMENDPCYSFNKIKFCGYVAKSCQVPDDCCDPALPIPCGIYGNRYACLNGTCVAEGCTTEQECQTFAKSIQQNDYANYTCFSAY